MDEVCIKGGIAATALQIPRTLLCFRNMPPYNFSFSQGYQRACYQFLAKQPRLAMVNNSFAGAQAYAEWLQLRKDAIKVVHNGLDIDNDAETTALRTQYRDALSIDEMTSVVGGVFRMSAEKRPFLWLDVAARIREKMPDVRFLLVGNGAQFDNVRLRAEQLGLMDVLSFTDLELRPAAAIAAMDLLFMSSRIEGFPIVLLEAQALGVPVVTTSGGGSPETVIDGKTGRVLKRDATAEVMADNIVDLLRDVSWRASAAKLGPEHAKTSFSARRMVDRMLAVCHEIGEQATVNEITESGGTVGSVARRSDRQESRPQPLQWLTTRLPSWVRRS
jgi:glycosyltransferase involved in cell wall biosynthesis